MPKKLNWAKANNKKTPQEPSYEIPVVPPCFTFHKWKKGKK